MKFKKLVTFPCKRDKEKIFDEIMKPILGDTYKSEWIADDKKYSYGIEGKKYCLIVEKKAGIIYERYFNDDVIGKMFNIKWTTK